MIRAPSLSLRGRPSSNFRGSVGETSQSRAPGALGGGGGGPAGAKGQRGAGAAGPGGAGARGMGAAAAPAGPLGRPWGAPAALGLAVLARLLVGLHPHSGEGAPPMFGDYEAQRHWMEVTLGLPPAEWYRGAHPANDLQYWGLDYPPLTAYQSYACGRLVALFEPAAVALGRSRGWETARSKRLLRLTVLLCDLLVLFPAAWLLAGTALVPPEGGAGGPAGPAGGRGGGGRGGQGEGAGGAGAGARTGGGGRAGTRTRGERGRSPPNPPPRE